jgi:nucleoside-diphosphate-sugar epimerase
MVNLLGKGFIGSRYTELTPNVIVNERNDYNVHAKDVLYMISTVDNYNVWTDPFIDIETNLTTLIKSLKSFRALDGGGTFNFISSWFVYGTVPLPAKEDSYCDPKGFYSITKRTAEQLLISYCETFQLKYRIIRLPNVLGETDTKVSKKKNALQYMLNQVQNNEILSLYDGGHALRDYMYVDDVVTAINLILEKGNTNEIYNIGMGKGISVRQCLDYAIKKTGSTSKIEVVEPAKFHKVVQTVNMVIDNTKIKSLGFLPKYRIYDIIDRLLDKKPTI